MSVVAQPKATAKAVGRANWSPPSARWSCRCHALGCAKRLASGLKREVRGPALVALEVAARAYPVREVAARSNAFIRSAEFVSGRVALVASGNLALALALDQRFPRRFLTRADERRADLLRFMVSPELGQIRAALGVAVA